MNTAIINDINYNKYAVVQQVLVTTTVGAGPTQLANGGGGTVSPTTALSTAGDCFFRKATVLGKKSLNGTNNAGIVKLGYAADVNKMPYTINPGDEITFQSPVGAKHSFADIWIQVAADNDGVVLLFS